MTIDGYEEGGGGDVALARLTRDSEHCDQQQVEGRMSTNALRRGCGRPVEAVAERVTGG